ncbi:MAG: ArsA family ATPase, partial [Acidimicrobiaceae bacterium]|nr:ArsA family ATPase [Acidimicrobiaceae bacterium]
AGEAPGIVIVCGSGGVGKTTTAAALAAMAALERGGRVLVVTVDPARRLANALGLEEFGNEEREIPPDAFIAGGAHPKGELWAAMLDTKQSWDALVRRHAPDAHTATRILENPLYQNIAGRFVQSHDYIAMERLYELSSEGGYDLIVVDTPPTRNALDFIEAPARMADFFSSRLLRLLIAPYRNRVVSMASRPFYQVADRILGSQFLADIAEFFVLFQTMYRGFVTRARAVEGLLADPGTTFVVVSTLEAAPLHEAQQFLDVLAAKRLHAGALVLNMVLPDYLLDPDALERARRLAEQATAMASSGSPVAVGARGGQGSGKGASVGGNLSADPAQVARVLGEVATNFVNFSVVARREAEDRRRLRGVPPVVATAPELAEDIRDLAGLLRLGRQIWA